MNLHLRAPYRVFVIAIAMLACTLPAHAAKQVTWNPNYNASLLLAKKQNRLILAYFSGSDWDEWGKKLQKEVLSSDAFIDWANKTVFCFQGDYPSNKPNDPWKKQNEELKTKYQISKVPTFLLLDHDGEIVARAGYDELKLLPSEPVGKPVASIEFLDNMVKNRGESEPLALQKSLAETIAYAKDHKLPVMLLITKPVNNPMVIEADKLVKNQKFVRWVNVNTSFYMMKMPEAADNSEDAIIYKALATKYKFGNTEAQLLMWQGDEDNLRTRIVTWNTTQMEPLMQRLAKELPFIDYKGTDWLADVRLAKAILAQQPKRAMFMYFTDGTEFCQKIEKEIFEKEEWTTWPYKNLVLVKLDYTKGVERPKYIDDQNAKLADLYGIRGYPMMILSNPKGQKIGEAKYMNTRGKPQVFIDEIKRIFNADIDKRLLTPIE